ncbi:MAG: hypothetical protein WA364_18335 [Candidatus Nitrosopolaris sp.]
MTIFALPVFFKPDQYDSNLSNKAAEKNNHHIVMKHPGKPGYPNMAVA